MTSDLYNRDWIDNNVYGLRDYRREGNRKTPLKKQDKDGEDDTNDNNDEPFEYRAKGAVVGVYTGLCVVEDVMFGRRVADTKYQDLIRLKKDNSGMKVNPTAQNNFGEWVVDPPANAVFSNVPFKSPLFRYTVQAEELKRTVHGSAFKVYKCIDYELEALPLTVNRLKFILKQFVTLKDADIENVILGGSWAYDANFYLKEKPKQRLNYNLNQKINDDNNGGNSQINYDYVIEGGLSIVISALHETLEPQLAKSVEDGLKGEAEFKLYFYNKEYLVIKRYYGNTKTLKMPEEQFNKLLEDLTTTPHDLCFRKLKKFMWKPNANDTIAVTKTSKRGLVKLPELTMDDLKRALSEFSNTVTTTKEDMLHVKIYSILKQDYEEKHTYTQIVRLAFSCSEYLPVIPKDKKEMLDKAINWLVSNYIAVRENEKLFLREAFKNEMTIAQCFERVFMNRIANEARNTLTDEDPLDSENITPMQSQQSNFDDSEANGNNNKRKKNEKNDSKENNKNNNKKKKKKEKKDTMLEDLGIDVEATVESVKDELCSEQRRALYHHLSNPLLIIIGKGGCGKTKLLSTIASLYKSGEILATAFQNANASALHDAVHGYAFTAHMLVYMHDTTCKRSPYCRGDQGIVDEHQIKGFKPLRPKQKGEMLSNIGIPYTNCIYENFKVLIVDEISTMYPELFAKLLGGLVKCGKLQSVIMAGDTAQLGSMYPGNLARDVWNAFEQFYCSVEFFHDHRLNTGPLSQTAQAIREGNPDGIVFDDQVCIHIPFQESYFARFNNRGNRNNNNNNKKNKSAEDFTLEDILEMVLDEYKIEKTSHHIITRTNKIKDRINRCVEDYYLRKEGKLPHVYQNGGKKRCQYVGQKYLFKKNDYVRGVANGQVLLLKSIEDYEDMRDPLPPGTNPQRSKEWRPLVVGKLVYDREDTSWPLAPMLARKLTFQAVNNKQIYKELEADGWVLDWIEYGNCTTTHGFQGSQTHTIIYILPYASDYETREAAYTAFTRPTHRAIFIGYLESLYKAISNPEPSRRTTLAQKIVHYCSKYKSVCLAYGKGTPLEDPPDVKEKLREELGEDDNKSNEQTEYGMEVENYRDINNNNNNDVEMVKFSGLLPVDMWLNILEYFVDNIWDIQRLMSWMRVSKDWYNLVTHKRLWIKIYPILVYDYWMQDELKVAISNPHTVEDDYFFKKLVTSPTVKYLDYWQCHKCNSLFSLLDVLHRMSLNKDGMGPERQLFITTPEIIYGRYGGPFPYRKLVFLYTCSTVIGYNNKKQAMVCGVQCDFKFYFDLESPLNKCMSYKEAKIMIEQDPTTVLPIIQLEECKWDKSITMSQLKVHSNKYITQQ